MKFLILLSIVLSAATTLASEKACRQVTIMRALSMVDRANQPQNQIKEVRQLYRLVCNNINPTQDIYYQNGVKAYSQSAKDWFFPSDQLALLANGEGPVYYPNRIKAYSEQALDWFYPSNKLAFLDAALDPGLSHPMYYPNGVKALSEIALDWFYPSNRLAFLHDAIKKNKSEDMFYPNGVKAYSKIQNDWHNPQDQFVFVDQGKPKLRTLFKLSGGDKINLKFKVMRKLRVLFTLNRIEKLQTP